ncbi:hypothetical protein P692DRAFT_20746770, partial [Suillus brevipes Sb2]
GIHPDLAKKAAVAEWPVPQNLLELMHFLGLTGYFQSLIKDYACLVLPLLTSYKTWTNLHPVLKEVNQNTDHTCVNVAWTCTGTNNMQKHF